MRVYPAVLLLMVSLSVGTAASAEVKENRDFISVVNELDLPALQGKDKSPHGNRVGASKEELMVVKKQNQLLKRENRQLSLLLKQKGRTDAQKKQAGSQTESQKGELAALKQQLAQRQQENQQLAAALTVYKKLNVETPVTQEQIDSYAYGQFLANDIRYKLGLMEKMKIKHTSDYIVSGLFNGLEKQSLVSAESLRQSFGHLIDELNSKLYKNIEIARKKLFQDVDRKRLIKEAGNASFLKLTKNWKEQEINHVDISIQELDTGKVLYDLKDMRVLDLAGMPDILREGVDLISKNGDIEVRSLASEIYQDQTYPEGLYPDSLLRIKITGR